MKKTTLLKKMAAISVFIVTPTLSFAKSEMTYDCVGMSSDGEKIISKLTITSTDKKNVYNTVWTYEKPKSLPDEGVAHVVNKNTMIEDYKSKKGLDNGQSTFYQISDQELLIRHSHFDNHHKLQFTRTGHCKKIPS